MIASNTIPSLQNLALNAVADAVNAHEPEIISTLPFGGARDLITRLAATGRLRPETLRPLLLSDSTSADALSSQLGESLVCAAPGCRGLSQL